MAMSAAAATGLKQMRRFAGSASLIRRCLLRSEITQGWSAVTPAAAAYATTLGVRSSSQYVHASQLSDVELPRCNFAEMVMKQWKTYGSAVAMVDAPSGRQYTYTQMFDAVAKTASGLKKLGFGRGDVLCLYSPNLPEYAIIYFAVLAIGGTVTLANPLYTRGELSRILDMTNTKIAVCIGLNLPILKGAVEDLPNKDQVKKLFVIGKPESGVPSIMSLFTDDGSQFDGIVPVDYNDEVACLPFSSGTMGLPKGVQLTHFNLTSNLAQSEHPDLFKSGPADSIASVLPFFHIYGLMAAMCAGLHTGCRLIVHPKWDMSTFLQTTAKYQVSCTSLVPPLIVALTKEPATSSYDLSAMQYVTCGAAPLSELQAVAFMEKFTNVKTFQQGFGMSEASPVITLNPRENFNLGSSGILVPQMLARVVDVSTGDDLSTGKHGELLIKGPNLMKGYFKDRQATEDVFTVDGWMKTGDIGYFDTKGHLFIVDRLKELIKYKGFQVAPAELEGILLTHPAVRDAAVIGASTNDGDEHPTAFIVLKEGEKVSESIIEEYVAEKVAPHKRLRGGVKFVDAIPKNPSGKILRRLLKDQLK